MIMMKHMIMIMMELLTTIPEWLRTDDYDDYEFSKIWTMSDNTGEVADDVKKRINERVENQTANWAHTFALFVTDFWNQKKFVVWK